MPYKDLRKLKLNEYELDSDTRDNFEAIEEYVNNDVFAKTGWEFAEIEISGAFTSSDPYKFKHNVKAIPKDVLITSTRSLANQSSVGTVAVIYDDIDSDFIYFTCTSPGAIVRFFFGTFAEQKK